MGEKSDIIILRYSTLSAYAINILNFVINFFLNI